MFLTILALGTLAVVALFAIEAMAGSRTLGWLSDQPVDTSSNLPGVSIVVSARNEEKNIREGLSSLLKLDYPTKEILVINDRSTDRTGEILRDIASKEPGFRVITVTDLPPGWLGKNHAQWSGANAAMHPLILFTDADIVMDPTALRRAVPFIEKNRIDHLAIGPRAIMPGLLLNLFMAGFAVFFNMFARPWRVRDPKSSAHIGIGAFNLIRRDVYDKIGTHKKISMRPDDDMKLGKLVKLNGFRQEFLIGTDMIFVEWYDSVRALVSGLMKNAFSGVDYRIEVVIGATFVQTVMGIWPFIAVFSTDGWARLAYIGTAVIIVALCATAARHQGLSPLYGFGFPLATAAFLFIMWKATLRTLILGGIEWRGTFYPLAELKRNQV